MLFSRIRPEDSMSYTIKLDNSEEAFRDKQICGPHCDPRILHAPGECSTCDEFPTLQRAREQWSINFTDHKDPKKHPCPANLARTTESLNSWWGNVRK